MSNRLLTLVNVLLVLVCAGCLYYLATARYEHAKELDAGQAWLAHADKPLAPETIITPESNTVPTGALGKPMMQLLYAPTPTPIPPPTPTPLPANLEQAVATWTITSINDDHTVEFTDSSNPEGPFTLTVGGPPKATMDKLNQTVKVILLSVDMNDLKATLGAADLPNQQIVKSF